MSCLSPEPTCELRPALPHALARKNPQIPHPCAAWQDLRICLPHASMRAAELRWPQKIPGATTLRRAAGEVMEWMEQWLEQQMQQVAGGDGSDCERTEARSEFWALESPGQPCG